MQEPPLTRIPCLPLSSSHNNDYLALRRKGKHLISSLGGDEDEEVEEKGPNPPTQQHTYQNQAYTDSYKRVML